MASTAESSDSDAALLDKLCIALAGYEFDEDRELKHLIKDNGGVSSFVVGNKTSHLIASYEEVAKNGFKVRNAKELKIPIVSDEWLRRSISEGTLLKVEEFKPVPPMQEYIPGEMLDYIVYKSHLEEYLEETPELTRPIKSLFAELLDLQPNLEDYYEDEAQIPELVQPFINPPSESVDGLAVIKQILRKKSDRVGYLRLRLGELLVWFLELKFIPLDKALRQSGIFGDLVDLGFRFPNCTILHCLVKHVVVKILHGNSNALKNYLLLEYDLVSKLVANYGQPAGWNGHVLHMAKTIDEVSRNVPFLTNYMKQRPRWRKFLAQVEHAEEVQLLPQDEYPPPRPVGNIAEWNALLEDMEEVDEVQE